VYVRDSSCVYKVWLWQRETPHFARKSVGSLFLRQLLSTQEPSELQRPSRHTRDCQVAQPASTAAAKGGCPAPSTSASCEMNQHGPAKAKGKGKARETDSDNDDAERWPGLTVSCASRSSPMCWRGLTPPPLFRRSNPTNINACSSRRSTRLRTRRERAPTITSQTGFRDCSTWCRSPRWTSDPRSGNNGPPTCGRRNRYDLAATCQVQILILSFTGRQRIGYLGSLGQYLNPANRTGRYLVESEVPKSPWSTEPAMGLTGFGRTNVREQVDFSSSRACGRLTPGSGRQDVLDLCDSNSDDEDDHNELHDRRFYLDLFHARLSPLGLQQLKQGIYEDLDEIPDAEDTDDEVRLVTFRSKAFRLIH
jgi:hypothetical protein